MSPREETVDDEAEVDASYASGQNHDLSSSEKTSKSLRLQKLVTKEDSFHMHKTLGILVLLSFSWRIRLLGESDMGFATFPTLTLPTLCLHVCLNLSSFEFRIPAKRIRTDGGRIWPQYRLHSLVFAARTLSCIAVNWYEEHISSVGKPNYDLNYYIVMVSMLLADVSSYSVAHENRSNSVRGIQAPLAVKYYFSAVQFFATTAVLYGQRRSSLYFYATWVIQVTAFLLTLRRKNLVPHSFNVVVFAILLGFGLSLGLYEYVWREDNHGLTVFAIIIVGCSACLWRMGPWPAFLRNKYLMWTILHYILLKRVLRPILLGEDGLLNETQLRGISCTLFVSMVLYGVYKHLRPRNKEKKKA